MTSLKVLSPNTITFQGMGVEGFTYGLWKHIVKSMAGKEESWQRAQTAMQT